MAQPSGGEGRTFAAPQEQPAQQPLPPGFVKAFRVPGNPPYLKEIKTGHVWPFSEGMAARGDFVVGVYDAKGENLVPPPDHPDYMLVLESGVPNFKIPEPPRRKGGPRQKREAAPVADVIDMQQE